MRKRKKVEQKKIDWSAIRGIGDVLRFNRCKQEKAQAAVAAAADISQKYLCEIEQGRRNLSMDCLLRLCSALDLKASAVVARVGK